MTEVKKTTRPCILCLKACVDWPVDRVTICRRCDSEMQQLPREKRMAVAIKVWGLEKDAAFKRDISAFVRHLEDLGNANLSEGGTAEMFRSLFRNDEN